MDLNIDYKLLVSLRRIIMQNIPHYCFDNIIINKNTTLLDNDHIKKRIMNIPVENLYIDMKKLKKIKDINIYNNNLDDIDFKLFDTLKMKCSKKYDMNNKNFIQSITTKDCEFYLNDKKIKNPMKYNIKIVDLKYDTDSFDFIASTNVNFPLHNTNYSVSETVILKPSKNGAKLIVNSRSESLSSKKILESAIYILKTKIKIFLIELENILSKKGKIKIDNDLFTLGYLYSYYLNKEKDISFCSLNIDTLIKKNCYLNFIINEDSKNNLKNIVKNINNNIVKELSNIKI